MLYRIYIWIKLQREKEVNFQKFFFELAKQEQIEDVWRQKNDNTKDYTFYSACKKSWSRIDLIWASKSLLPRIRKADIMPKIMLDHNPVVCTLRSKPRINRWRLNEEILEKKENLTYIQNEINFFLKQNWNCEVSNNVVWDTFKAYLRGILIARSNKEKKERDKKLNELQQKIKEKEKNIRKPGL